MKTKTNNNGLDAFILEAKTTVKTESLNINVENSNKDQNCTNLFKSLDTENRSYVTPNQIWETLGRYGIDKSDPRLKKACDLLTKGKKDRKIELDEFCKIVNENALIKKSLAGDLAIPDFESFCEEITDIYNKTKKNKGGNVADYIPQLARVNPENFAISICTVDGQRFSIGDYDTNFCVQSTCKAINYCIAHEELGEEEVHKYVGREPSGKSFNELALNNDGLPHNPLINSGAIMSCSLIKPKLQIADRFDHVMNVWNSLTVTKRPSFNNSVYLSERQTADRNFALGYFMRENNAFPEKTDLIETLEFYFQCCSIELNAEMMASAAATLANSGISPVTGKKVFDAKTVQNCLSLMYSCGMYDFSGEFAFKIGLPAKSGVSGALMVIIPGVMGICVYSPPLDSLGNSVRGIEFCDRLVEQYNFHNYDTLTSKVSTKKDPRLKKYESKTTEVLSLCWAASEGDLNEIQRLVAKGVDLNIGDYDGRTPLHLAASEGQLEVVKYFMDQNVQLNPKDRWGGTPLSDALSAKHIKTSNLLEKNGAISKN